MPNYKVPGVYVSEVQAPHPVVGAPTSVAAFVGCAERGTIGTAQRLTAWADFQRLFGGLWRNAPMGYAVSHFFANGGSQAMVVRLTNGAECAFASPRLGNADLSLRAASEGAWGNAITVSVKRDGRRPGTFDLLLDERGEGSEPRAERFDGLSLDPAAPRFVGTVLAGSALVTLRAIEPVEGSPADTQSLSCRFSGGSDGSGIVDEQVRNEGLAALDAVSFNLLCLPPLSWTADLAAETHAAAAAYCNKRRAFYVADAPRAWDKADHPVAAARDGLPRLFPRSKDAAVFFPRLRAPDALDEGRVSDFAPCGAVAGVIARTDDRRGVWKAPAGMEARLVGVLGLSLKLNGVEGGLLNPAGINCLRVVPVQGTVVWGGRTLAGEDSEWKYISSRRLGLLIEESVSQGMKWAAFEPNGEALWAQLRNSIAAFMQNLFHQGAFQGKAVRDAFFVKCDAGTTTQSDIENGVLNVWVGFAPLKPAEFIILRIRQARAAPGDDD